MSKTTSELQPFRDIFNKHGANYSQVLGEETTVVSMQLEGFNSALQDLTHLIAEEKRKALEQFRAPKAMEEYLALYSHTTHSDSLFCHVCGFSPRLFNKAIDEAITSLSGEDKGKE